MSPAQVSGRHTVRCWWSWVRLSGDAELTSLTSMGTVDLPRIRSRLGSLPAWEMTHDVPRWATPGQPTNDSQSMNREYLSLIHISEPTRQAEISYAVFC